MLGKSHGHCKLEFLFKVNLTLCDAYTEWLESHIMQLYGTCMISKSFVDNNLHILFKYNYWLFFAQGCDRNSEEKHALSHNGSNPSHSIVVHLQNWVVW